MSVKNRYLFLKNIYSDYLIIFQRKDNYLSYGMDNEILKYIKINNLKKININYIILKNMTIKEQQHYLNNLYNEYYLKCSFLKLIDYISNNIKY